MFCGKDYFVQVTKYQKDNRERAAIMVVMISSICVCVYMRR